MNFYKIKTTTKWDSYKKEGMDLYVGAKNLSDALELTTQMYPNNYGLRSIRKDNDIPTFPHEEELPFGDRDIYLYTIKIDAEKDIEPGCEPAPYYVVAPEGINNVCGSLKREYANLDEKKISVEVSAQIYTKTIVDRMLNREKSDPTSSKCCCNTASKDTDLSNWRGKDSEIII